MKQNGSLISFGKINKYFIIPFLCPIFCFLVNYFIFLNAEIPKINEIEVNIKNKLCLISFSIILSYFGGGLLYCISYIRTKTEDIKKSKEDKRDELDSFKSKSSSPYSVEYIYNKEIKQNNPLKIFSILFVISLIFSFDLICKLLAFNQNVFERRLYFLLFLPIFSKIILKSELFRHQILSLFISIIGIILLFILTILNGNIPIFINILIFISTVGYSLFLIMIKQLTHKYYLSPYFCLLYVGFFSLIILLVGFIIYYSIIGFDNFMKNFENETLTSIIYLILAFSFCLILQVLTFLVIYYFSPTLLMVTDIIHPIITWIISIFQKKEHTTIEIVLCGTGYFIIFFSSLIYNEIIIFNFCGLNRNTKKYLEIKQKEEFSSIIRNDDDDNEPNERENDTN
jgi:hypothetical protein